MRIVRLPRRKAFPTARRTRNKSPPPARAKRSELHPVTADRLDRTSFHRLFTQVCFLIALRLLENVAVSAVVIPCKIRGRRFTAEIAIDALIVDVIFAADILRVFVGEISHEERGPQK